MSVSESGKVGVLERAVAILEAVEEEPRTFTDLVEETGFTRATTHRLAKALEAHGLLTFARGRYRLGPWLLRLATTAMRELPLRDLAHPALERLAQVTGESAQLYVRSDDRRLCLDSVQSTNELRTIVEIGASLPITAGSAGKVFMAWAPPPDRERLVAAAAALTPRTPVGERLHRQLLHVRRRGWADSAGEREPGVGSVSAPVLGPQGELLAVVSVSGPVARIGRASAGRYTPAVRVAASEIESALGGP